MNNEILLFKTFDTSHLVCCKELSFVTTVINLVSCNVSSLVFAIRTLKLHSKETNFAHKEAEQSDFYHGG